MRIPADFKLFNEKTRKIIKKSLSPCVFTNKECFVLVPTTRYTSLDSLGLRKHHANLSGVNLMLLTGDNEV